MSLIGPVYIMYDPDKLDRILAALAELKEILMAIKPELTAVLARIDAATNAIGARLDALANQIKTDMTDAEVEQVRAQLAADADRLEAMGKSPDNPAPEVPAAGAGDQPAA